MMLARSPRHVPQGTGYAQIGSVAPQFEYLDALVTTMIRQRPDDRLPSVETVKRELIARGNEFVSRQELSRLSNKVLPVTAVDDPLVTDPIRVIDASWDNGVLTLYLNRHVNPAWVQVLQFGGYSRSAIMGVGPERFKFAGDRASVPVSGDSAQRAVDYFKSWLPLVNQIYAHNCNKSWTNKTVQFAQNWNGRFVAEKRRSKSTHDSRCSFSRPTHTH